MNGIFRTYLSLSASGSLLIAVLLLCKPVLRDRFSRRWQYYIWLVVIARLLLPLSPENSLMGTLFRQADSVPAAVSLPGEDAVHLPPSFEMPDLVSPPQDEGSAGPVRELWETLPQKLWAIWLGGAAILLIRKITIYQSFGRYMRAGCTEVSDIALLDRLAETGGQLGIKRPVELYENRLAASPMLLGFFRPCIVLPDAALSEADFRYTLRHELTHYQRRDLLYKWLVQLTVCLHWFNPMVWLMGREISRACELACDEAVIRDLEPLERRAYGDMLLRATAAGGSFHSSAGSVTLHESGEVLKERLGAIMNFKKSSKLVTVFSGLLAAVLLMGAAATGAYTNPARETAAVLPPNSVKGDPSYAFRYTQEGYYEAPYLFEIGWNVRENAEKLYYNTQIKLSDGSAMTVLLSDICKNSLKDADILNALTTVLSRLKKETAAAEFPLTRPLVMSVTNTGITSASALTEQCYQDKNIASYTAAFALLDEDMRRVYLNKCFDDKQIAFWGASWNLIAENSPLVEEFAEKTYQAGNISFFSVVANNMSQSVKEAWAVRAIQDNQLAFSSVLAGASGTGWAQQNVDEMKAEREKQQLAEYKNYGITKSGEDYYYQGQLTRIFVDFSANQSFVTLRTNPSGTVKIKVTRNTDGSIKSVGYLTESEIAELFGDDLDVDLTNGSGDYAVSTGTDKNASVENVSKEDLPEAVCESLDSCAVNTWYLLRTGGRQYLYYDGFAWSFGYAPKLDGGKWTVDIVRFQKKDSGCLLLSLPDNAPVSVTCDGQPVALTETR